MKRSLVWMTPNIYKLLHALQRQSRKGFTALLLVTNWEPYHPTRIVRHWAFIRTRYLKSSSGRLNVKRLKTSFNEVPPDVGIEIDATFGMSLTTKHWSNCLSKSWWVEGSTENSSSSIGVSSLRVALWTFSLIVSVFTIFFVGLSFRCGGVRHVVKAA